MSRRARLLWMTAMAALLLLLIFGRAGAIFVTEALWFESLGHGGVFWTRVLGSVGVRAAVALLGAAVVLGNLWRVVGSSGPVHVRRRYGNLEIAERIPRRWILSGITLVAMLTGWWISGLAFPTERAMTVLAWLQAPAWGAADPVFGRDVAFYVFALPVWTALLDFLLLVTGWTAVLAAAGYVVVGGVRLAANRLEADPGAREHFAWLGAALLVLVGVRWWLGRYFLLLDGSGFGGGVGYTDVHARMPGHVVLAVLSVLVAATIVHAVRVRRPWLALAAGAGLVVGALAIGVAWPSFVERFRVEPNQLERESPFVAWRIEATRAAYGLNGLERRVWDPRTAGPLDAAAAADELEGLPLWDAEPLRTALNQVQTLYGYYQFSDVAFDRYPAGDGAAQVAISVREFQPSGLPDGAATWRSLHLNPEYRRGWGAVVTGAAHTAQGEPRYWLSGLDPVRLYPEAPPTVGLADPRVYFGRTMGGYVLVDAASDTAFAESAAPPRTRPALDGPQPGGVAVGSLLRRTLFAVREGETNLLFADEITPDTRIVLHRRVADRVRALAPFLLWSGSSTGSGSSFGEPYPVIHDGRLVWVVDGFSVSAWYPVSARYDIRGLGRVSYLRHTVKAVVDAVTGEVAMYAVDATDPILTAYRGVFPGLIQDLEALPAGLVGHLRYPPAFIRAQADILDEYHLDDPAAFFAGQDFWQLPGASRVAGPPAYRPIQMLTRLPDSQAREFLVVVPFIARERENMTAILVGRSDPPHYGELVLLELPRDERIKGPDQIQTIIEQDPEISQQLSLWRQGGSTVDDGELRIVPVGDRILYVQPLFLSSQAGSIPQLQRVVVSDGTSVAMGVTLPLALRALAAERGAPSAAGTDAREGEAQALPEPLRGVAGTPWADEALELLDAADAALRAGDFAAFGERWNALQRLLRSAAADTAGGG